MPGIYRDNAEGIGVRELRLFCNDNAAQTDTPFAQKGIKVRKHPGRGLGKHKESAAFGHVSVKLCNFLGAEIGSRRGNDGKVGALGNILEAERYIGNTVIVLGKKPTERIGYILVMPCDKDRAAAASALGAEHGARQKLLAVELLDALSAAVEHEHVLKVYRAGVAAALHDYGVEVYFKPLLNVLIHNGGLCIRVDVFNGEAVPGLLIAAQDLGHERREILLRREHLYIHRHVELAEHIQRFIRKLIELVACHVQPQAKLLGELRDAEVHCDKQHCRNDDRDRGFQL